MPTEKEVITVKTMVRMEINREYWLMESMMSASALIAGRSYVRDNKSHACNHNAEKVAEVVKGKRKKQFPRPQESEGER